MLSAKAKESFKTALAVTIARWIALSMDWNRPQLCEKQCAVLRRESQPCTLKGIKGRFYI